MTSPNISVVVVVAAVLAGVMVLGWYLTFSATRLDRLHARLEGARSALDAQLVRRASVALQIAGSGRLDPATSLLLADAAHEAREVDGSDQTSREVTESNLTGALQAAFAEPSVAGDLRQDPVGRELLHELSAAGLRVQLARRFLNDVVRAARVVRRKRVVRYLRLAGHAEWPATFEMSDTPPDTVAGAAFI
ncbi:MAG: hypothetical protein LH461_09110 [Spirochaetaceae bacterium]|nr:hypothetical protein [Spirochaetaceae bacterium]